ncbi:twitchin-like isoform X2 [Ruditapes philippinarum]|uniref:twitchin-like isoform X2 n=1 Tax=Ruditapes philippinarum TaxID=129788 RepID=UPI00295B5F4E|nr:twitchin-like isoform X2 [Ruditapes philippinarum]
MPQSGGTDLEPHVSALTYVLCWPYYLCLKEGTSGRKLVGKSQKDKPGAPGVPKCKTTTEDSITLFWTPPNRDGGNPVTGYVLERREKGDVIWETSSYSVNQVTEFTVEGLQDGKEYEFRVAACNNAGTGEFSNYSEPIKVQPPPNKQIWIEELPKDLLDTPLSNEMCVGFHDYFGHDWEIIAKHLKLRQATIDHIDADKRSQSLKIDRMIRTYVDEYQPTVGDFLRLLKSCSQTPTIEWTLLKNHFEKML